MRYPAIGYLLLILTGLKPVFVLGGEPVACDQHTCCCHKDLTPAGVMISHIHPRKEWMLSYRYMTMNMNGLVKGSEATGKNDVFVNYLMSPEQMRMDMHMLMGMYGLTDRLTVMGMLNYNSFSMEMSMFASAGAHHHTGAADGSGLHHMETSGIGDVKLYALYGLLNKGAHQLLVNAGVSIPTGSVQAKGADDDMMYTGSRFPYGMQLGSGTYDLMPGVCYLYQHGKTAFSTQVSSVIRTGSNEAGYKLGNEIGINTWVARQWLSWLSSSLRAEVISTGRVRGHDLSVYNYNEPAANPANYGGEKVTCLLGAVLRYPKGLLKNNSLGIEYGIPVYQNWNGVQLKQQQQLNLSLSMAF